MARQLGSERYLDVRSLDKWLIIGPNEQRIRRWLDMHFHVGSMSIATNWLYVSPIFDPLDPILVRLAIQDSNIKGQIYHEIINLFGDRSDHTQSYPTFKQEQLILEAYRNKRIRDLNQTHMHPQPLEYEGDSLWERNLSTPVSAHERHLSMYSDRWSLLENSSVSPIGTCAPVSQMEQTKHLGVARRLSEDPLR